MSVVNSRRCSVALAALSVSFSLPMFGFAPSAKAASAPVTFAQFTEATGATNANEFAYTDGGVAGGATLTTTVASIPIIFNFVSVGALAGDLTGPQNASLTLTNVSTTSPVTSTAIAGYGTLGLQPITGDGAHAEVLTITRDTPAAEGTGSMDILLQMTFTGGLGGILGGFTPQLQGSSNGGVVNYASDFISFGTPPANDFNIAFSSWITTADGGGLEPSPTALDANFATATAAATGTFDTATTLITTGGGLPEPSGCLIVGVGAMAALGGRRRRRIA